MPIYHGEVTIQRFRDLVGSVIGHAAQLAYAERTSDAVALLTAADRVFRAVAIGPSRGLAPLGEELAAARGLLQVAGVVAGFRFDLGIELDPLVLSSTFVAPGALLDSIDLFITDLDGKEGAGTLALSKDADGRGLVLRGPGRSLIVDSRHSP